MQYFRVPWRDYELVRMMEGCRNAAEVVRKWKKHVPELALEMSDGLLLQKVAVLIRDFESRKLCEMGAANLLQLRAKRKDLKTLGRRVMWMVSWLIIRKSLYDPDPLLTKITPESFFSVPSVVLDLSPAVRRVGVFGRSSLTFTISRSIRAGFSPSTTWPCCLSRLSF